MIALSQQVHRAFFAQYGGRLRPIQEIAYEEMTLDRDALVAAPTGGGKTEAVFAPLAQRLVDEDARRSNKLRALIISPTRALASDLHKRMAPVFKQLGLRLDVATSDKRTITSTPSDALIRTPEGLDVDIVRRSGNLTDVRDVVIDEVHLFLENARGTQLSGLLARLCDVAPTHRRLGLSATIPDMRAPMQASLLRDPVVVQPATDDESRIEVIYHDWVGNEEQAATSFVQALRNLGVRKALGFVSRKRRAEELAKLLSRGYFRNKCFPHHGDLASAGRRRVEAQLREMPVALVVATTTLEVGIDIGSIDTCILFDAPPNRAAFVQRAGRSGRRSGRRRVVCLAGLYDNRIDFAHVAASISRENVGTFKPFLAGCLQQILSYIVQANGRSRSSIHSFVATAFGMSSSIADLVLTSLERDRWVSLDDEQVKPTARLEELGRFRKSCG